jgi:S-adenosylmethionine/arginine decarboxylase-like enzyme
MFKPDHLHVLIKGTCNKPPLDTESLNDWFIRLVDRVRMVVVAGPTSVYVNEEGNEGLTGTVTLATSHASIHFWDRSTPPMFQFDLYSCSCFSVSEILEHLSEFDLVSVEWLFIDRNDGFKIIEAGKC